MTRNTKLYDIKIGRNIYTFRDLTILELSYLSNIKNKFRKTELAGQMVLQDVDISLLNWTTLSQIGMKALELSDITDDIKFELTIKEFRSKVKNDSTLALIRHILETLKNESLLELLNLTHRDLIELGCICELIQGKSIFKVGPQLKKGMKLASQEEVKSLQQKMKELNQHLK